MLYLSFAVQIMLMIGVPIGLWLTLTRRRWGSWGLVVAGALTFIASQVVHLPLNWALGLLGGARGVALWPLPAMAAVVGLSAGVCEEGARYLVLRYWKRQARSWEEGVTYGAGHGGVESLLLGILVAVNVVALLVLRQTGSVPSQYQHLVDEFWSVAWYMPLLGGAERLFAITIQIALTLLVMQVFVRGSLLWLGLAIVLHAVVDGAAVSMVRLEWSPLVIEGVVGLFALGGLGVILALASRRPYERRWAAPGDD